MDRIENSVWANLLKKAEDLKLSCLTRHSLIYQVIGEERILGNSTKVIVDTVPVSDRHYAINRILDESGVKILDVGCGIGELLKIFDLKKEGKSLYGVDIDSSRIKSAENLFSSTTKNKVRFFTEDVISPQFIQRFSRKLKLPNLNKFFDTIILNQVLEHFTEEDGIKLLRELVGMCMSNIFITVPNISCLPILAYNMLIPEQLIFESHKIFFTPQLLENMLNKIGKEVEVKEYLKFITLNGIDCSYYIFAKIGVT